MTICNLLAKCFLGKKNTLASTLTFHYSHHDFISVCIIYNRYKFQYLLKFKNKNIDLSTEMFILSFKFKWVGLKVFKAIYG